MSMKHIPWKEARKNLLEYVEKYPAAVWNALDSAYLAGLEDAERTTKGALKIGDRVDKLKGYRFPSTVVAVFQNTKGETRVVAELDGYGLLHIFSEEQLCKVGE